MLCYPPFNPNLPLYANPKNYQKISVIHTMIKHIASKQREMSLGFLPINLEVTVYQKLLDAREAPIR